MGLDAEMGGDVSEIKDGGAAFPLQGFSDGMSLRDYFAAKALQAHLHPGILTPVTKEVGETKAIGLIAGASYAWADAMLKARAEQDEIHKIERGE